jgi:hypothetical protein
MTSAAAVALYKSKAKLLQPLRPEAGPRQSKDSVMARMLCRVGELRSTSNGPVSLLYSRHSHEWKHDTHGAHAAYLPYPA